MKEIRAANARPPRKARPRTFLVVDFADVIVADGRGVRDLQFVDTAGNHGDGFVQLVASRFTHTVVAADFV